MHCSGKNSLTRQIIESMKTSAFSCISVLLLLSFSCGTPKEKARLRVLDDEYPRAYFFRMAENTYEPYEEWERNLERLMGIQGKALDEEVVGRMERNPDFFTRFKQNHPDQLVLLHFNGNARDPRYRREKFFAGHWIYFPGARILSEVPAGEEVSEIRVSDASLFKVNIGRYMDRNEDIGLCELDEQGKPDWHKSEQVQLLSVDTTNNIIQVRRACFGADARTFGAGKSYAAAHVHEGPWGEKNNLMWPKYLRDDDRIPDVDADGRPDEGIIDGVNTYGIGNWQFLKAVRQELGPDRLILADGFRPSHQRGFGILNGMESEGWPDGSDHEINGWSGGINRQLFWNGNSAQPGMTYINHRWWIHHRMDTILPLNIERLVMAASCLAKQEADLIGSQDPNRLLERLMDVNADLMFIEDGGWVKIESLGLAGNTKMEFTIENVPSPTKDLTVFLTMKGEPMANYPAKWGRLVRVSPAGYTHPGMKEGLNTGNWYMTWMYDTAFESVFYYPEMEQEVVSLRVEVEGTGPVWIRQINAYAAPDARARAFRHGVVLANPAPHSCVFDLSELFPGEHFARLTGSSKQDPVTNDGSSVSGEVQLQGKDALFLIIPR
jgi:hypothetical protein